MLDRWFRRLLALGGVLVAVGGLVRLGGHVRVGDGRAGADRGGPAGGDERGQQGPRGISASSGRPGIALGSAGVSSACSLALLLGPLLGGGQLALLLEIQGRSVCSRRRAGPALRRPGAARESARGQAASRGRSGAPDIRILCGLAFLGFGVFVALSTWLQTLLHPDGVSETTAGALLVGMILMGVVGCAVLPAPITRRGAERGFMLTVVAVGWLGSLALGVLRDRGRVVVMVAMGAVLLPALPVIMTVAERLAGTAAGTAGAIVWLAGNLGGLVVALLVQALVHQPLAAFIAMASLFCSPPRLRCGWSRCEGSRARRRRAREGAKITRAAGPRGSRPRVEVRSPGFCEARYAGCAASQSSTSEGFGVGGRRGRRPSRCVARAR